MTPEWTYPINLLALNFKEPQIFSLSAPENVRDALAKRFDLPSIQKLKGTISVDAALDDSGHFYLKGTIEADFTQICVKSLSEFPNHLRAEMDVLLTAYPIENYDEDDRDVEPLIRGCIDIGELISQYFYISLDPYPKNPNLPHKEGNSPMELENNPFAILRMKQ